MINILYQLTNIKIGWMALAVSILTTKTIDQALIEMDPGLGQDYKLIRYQEDEDIIILRNQGLTWKEIGQIFNCSNNAAYSRAKNFRERSRLTA